MRRSEKSRVLIITLLVALASILVGLAALSKTKSRLVEISTNEYKTQQSLLANQIADTLSHNLENVQNQLRVMATMPEIKDTNNPEVCNAKLKELLAINQKQLGNLARVDTTGHFACSANPAIIGQDSARYGGYINDLIADPEHKPVLGRVTRPTGTNSLAAGLHVPVYEGSKFVGTLGGAMYFDRYQDEYLKSIKLGENGFVVVMDDNGDILYHPSKDQNGKNLLDPEVLSSFEPQSTMRQLVEQVRANKSGVFDYSAQGMQKIGLYKTIEVLNGSGRHWAVVVAIPIEDIENAVNKAGINRMFLWLVLLFSLSTGAITFVSLRNSIKSLEVQRMKDEFIALTSHQLRTPATIVKQYLDLLRSGYAKSKRETNKFINIAYESNETQLEIIENILSVSRLQAGHLEIQKKTIVLQDLVNKATNSLKTEVVSKKTQVVSTPAQKPITMHVDAIKLTMATENLISNAIKYTPTGGKINVSIVLQKGRVLIRVKDNGQGISKRDIPKLFKRFNRLDINGASSVPGTGLGLYLTKQIVELHKGTLTVVSKVNKESIFTIDLPLG